MRVSMDILTFLFVMMAVAVIGGGLGALVIYLQMGGKEG